MAPPAQPHCAGRLSLGAHLQVLDAFGKFWVCNRLSFIQFIERIFLQSGTAARVDSLGESL
jgi:hypothetical protein